jgi:uncharacterized protein
MPRNLRDREFIGTGLAFPLQFSPRGEIALATGGHDIEQAMRLILETMPGERVMRPRFGCRAKELIFAPRNSATKALLITYVQDALAQWEPRIEVRGVTVHIDAANDGAWLVEISYEVKTTHDERSLVHPFYILNEVK